MRVWMRCAGVISFIDFAWYHRTWVLDRFSVDTRSELGLCSELLQVMIISVVVHSAGTGTSH